VLPLKTIPKTRTVLSALVRWALAGWLLASLLFAHSCHGNEDNELFTAYMVWIEN
jgi:hypothetical protein